MQFIVLIGYLNEYLNSSVYANWPVWWLNVKRLECFNQKSILIFKNILILEYYASLEPVNEGRGGAWKHDPASWVGRYQLAKKRSSL